MATDNPFPRCMSRYGTSRMLCDLLPGHDGPHEWHDANWWRAEALRLRAAESAAERRALERAAEHVASMGPRAVRPSMKQVADEIRALTKEPKPATNRPPGPPNPPIPPNHDPKG